MKCEHLGRVVARSECENGTPFEILQCNHFGRHCSVDDIGLTNHGDRTPFLTCASCPAFPLVSAICLAYDLPRRLTVLEESIESFHRQTWHRKELIIVVDAPGLVIHCEQPGVRVVSVPPCTTLGEKYNAGVRAASGSLICSWDDDDISLPWRMAMSVELLGKSEYFNPKAYWFLRDDGIPLHEVNTGYAHNASMFRKSVWLKVGGYQHLADNSQDAKMDAAMHEQCSFVHGAGGIEQTAYIYRWQSSVTHGSAVQKKEIGAAGEFTLCPHWEQDYTKLTLANRPAGVPVWLTNRDTLQVSKMVDRLVNCVDVGPITIVDCESTYQPLLDWYDAECPVTVVRTENHGPMAPWKFLDQSAPYIVSDGDLDLDNVPRDFVSKMRAGLEKFPQAIKVGLSLRIDDLPQNAPKTAGVIAHESKFWQKSLDGEHFDAAIDTTLAMYRGGSGWGGYEPAIRLNAPYTARHVAWYLTPETMTPDWRHYFGRLKTTGLQWSPVLAESFKPVEWTGPKLTIGMASYRDAGRTTMTIMGLLLSHPDVRREEIEIVVVDNDLQGEPDNDGRPDNHSRTLKLFCGQNATVYDHYTAVQGTAAAKGRIFEIAKGRTVLVIDCHVILPTGTLRKLIDWSDANPDSKDLLQGPLIGDGLGNAGDHFAQNWGSWMLGQWATTNDPEPFEIEAHACGLFACNKHAWPGFHPLLRGFGPEEGHLHKRIRRNGGKCWSMPWLRWWHGFSNPGGSRPAGLAPADRLRGYLIDFLDTGAPSIADLRRHYVEEMRSISHREFDAVLAKTRDEFGDTQIRGLGDRIEQILNVTGIGAAAKAILGDDCGCGARRELVNRITSLPGPIPQQPTTASQSGS